jgi:hypothetical protein
MLRKADEAHEGLCGGGDTVVRPVWFRKPWRGKPGPADSTSPTNSLLVEDREVVETTWREP